MGILDFSTAVAWRPLALQALNGPTPVELFWQVCPALATHSSKAALGLFLRNA